MSRSMNRIERTHFALFQKYSAGMTSRTGPPLIAGEQGATTGRQQTVRLPQVLDRQVGAAAVIGLHQNKAGFGAWPDLGENVVQRDPGERVVKPVQNVTQ